MDREEEDEMLLVDGCAKKALHNGRRERHEWRKSQFCCQRGIKFEAFDDILYDKNLHEEEEDGGQGMLHLHRFGHVLSDGGRDNRTDALVHNLIAKRTGRCKESSDDDFYFDGANVKLACMLIKLPRDNEGHFHRVGRGIDKSVAEAHDARAGLEEVAAGKREE